MREAEAEKEREGKRVRDKGREREGGEKDLKEGETEVREKREI